MNFPKLVGYCSVLINLSLTSRECTPENCKNGMNKKYMEKLFKRKNSIGKDFATELEEYSRIINHKTQKIPESFDARKKWPNCKSISRIKDKDSCKTSWAVTTAMTATDRLCVSRNGKRKFDFSPQDIITCCDDECYVNPVHSTCDDAGNPLKALVFMVKEGVVSTKCKTYNTATIEEGCDEFCENGKTRQEQIIKIPRIAIGNIGAETTLEDMQIEIMKYGPIVSLLAFIPKEFSENYTDQVFTSTEFYVEKPVMAVKIIGWGINNGVPYWLCANTWGKQWGKLGGFFKIRRRTNELGIETVVMAADFISDDKDNPDEYVDKSTTENVNENQNNAKTLEIFIVTYIVVIVIYV